MGKAAAEDSWRKPWRNAVAAVAEEPCQPWQRTPRRDAVTDKWPAN